MLKRLLPGLKSTSSMTAGDIKALKIRYLGINDISIMFPEAGGHQRNSALGMSYDHLLLRDIQAKEILSLELERESRLNPQEKGLIKRLQRVIISGNASVGTIDSKTCDLVADILTGMGLNTFPLSTNKEPAYKYDISLGEAFISVPSYVVEKGRVALVIDEDRRLGYVNRINQWGEHQLAGDMLACGLAGNSQDGDINIYGLRVIGTRFTFYRAILKEDYYMKLYSTNKPFMDIERFPTVGTSETLENRSLDFKDPGQRSVIVDVLARMAHSIRNHKQD